MCVLCWVGADWKSRTKNWSRDQASNGGPVRVNVNVMNEAGVSHPRGQVIPLQESMHSLGGSEIL